MSTRKSPTGESRSKFTRNISYKTLPSEEVPSCAGTLCATPTDEVKKSAPDAPVVPLSNVTVANYDGGMPDNERDLALMRLQRQIMALKRDQRVLLNKLTRCAAVIADTERFFDVGLQYGQWETYSQLQARRARLRGTREMILDAQAEPIAEEQLVKELREKLKI